MSDRDCENCKHHTEKGCDSWDCNFEPCDIAISKQAVLDIIDFEDKWLFDAKRHNADTKIAFSGMKSSVLALPPVNPQEPKINILDKIRSEIEKLADDEWNKQVGSVSQGLEDAIEIIDKYKAESEEVNDTDI